MANECGDRRREPQRQRCYNDQPMPQHLPYQTRLAIFLPSLEGGGAERVMANLAEGFAERGMATDLVLANAKGPYLAQLSGSVRVVDLRAPRVLASILPLRHYLRSSRPAALLSGLNYANLVALWAKRLSGVDTRMVVTVHNQLTTPSEAPPPFKERAIHRLMHYAYPRAHHIVAVSNGVADDLSRTAGIPRHLIHTIYNPVVSEAMLARGGEPLAHPWFGPGQPPVILAIGRFYEQKDFPNLIRAFARLAPTTDGRLLILGDGPQRPQLEGLVRQLGLEERVALPGFVDNPYAYLKRARVFALSSKWEGLPTVLIEALAFGKAIVSTNCKSGPEEILERGRYGTLVPIADDEALARALRRALTEPPPDYDPQQATARFTMESAVDAYLAAAGLPLPHESELRAAQ